MRGHDRDHADVRGNIVFGRDHADNHHPDHTDNHTGIRAGIRTGIRAGIRAAICFGNRVRICAGIRAETRGKTHGTVRAAPAPADGSGSRDGGRCTASRRSSGDAVSGAGDGAGTALSN